MPGNDYKNVQGNWDVLGVPETIWVVTGTKLGATGNMLEESGSDWGPAGRDWAHTGSAKETGSTWRAQLGL